MFSWAGTPIRKNIQKQHRISYWIWYQSLKLMIGFLVTKKQAWIFKYFEHISINSLITATFKFEITETSALCKTTIFFI